ncbi:MAG TPA: antitoxin [Candidatus Binatia bacterium]|nr:antitoxin [Candidatus Binatia bacterium]
MRTTLTLDPDVARMIQDAVHRLRKPLKQVVNDALRRALAPKGRRPDVPRYRVRPHVARLRPGLDRGKLNALADELEDRALVATLRRRRAP